MSVSNLTCPWDAANFIFYSTDPGVPTLLYYSYIPIILATLFFCFYVFFKNGYSFLSKILLVLGLAFAGYTLNAIFQWTSNDLSSQMFSWQLNGFFEVSVFLMAAYFIYVFFSNGQSIFYGTLALVLSYLPVVILLPTNLNIKQFYLTSDDCGGVLGSLWIYIYGIEIISVLCIAYLCMREVQAVGAKQRRKGEAFLLGAGSIVFLGIFGFSNVLGEVTKVYQVNLMGPIGLLCFVFILAIMIVRYQAFNIKLFATQALVAGIAVLIGARLFYSTTVIGTVLSVVTLIGFLVSGVFLIRSVKKEIAQRELLEELTQQLGETNSRQETLLHFIGHEVKGTLAKDEGVFAAISEGDLGDVTDTVKTFAQRALAESRAGAASVENILKASNLKKGTVTYTKVQFDLKELVSESVETEKHIAEAKGLALSFTADDASYQMIGDKAQINSHVLRNLLENSINYTPSGSIEVSLKRVGAKIIIAVKDSGVGISDEDKERLFKEGGHGKNSQSVNVHSTGYGLYIAKQIVLEHGGTVRAESEGAGKGATFIVEFPAT